MHKEDIMKVVTTIRDSDADDKEEHFYNTYKEFRKKYPQLYKMCCQPSFAKDPAATKTLEYMLNMMSSIDKKEKTSEEASIAVGQELFTKFVDVSKLKKADGPAAGPQIVIK